MSKVIPLSVPNFIGNEKRYVLDAIEKQWVSTGGEYIKMFEESIAKYLNVKSAVACQSGTSGLHLSLIKCGVGVDDEVIAPTLTFIAAINPIRYIGAYPIFMDCDDSLTIDVDKVRLFCEDECEFIKGKLINKKSKRHIKAMVVVHVFGNMCNMEAVIDIADKYNLMVVEDATEALGSKYISGKFKDKYAGTIGDFGVYSFNGNKIITTGGGGMVVSKDESLLEEVRYLSTQAKDDELYYIHNDIGYNYRMTNLQGALGLAQLECLKKFIQIKEKNYLKYKNEIRKIDGLKILDFNYDIKPNYWFYSLLIKKDKFNINRDELMNFLKDKGIQTRPVWGLIHNQKPYIDCESYKIEKAEKYLDSILNIPCSTNLENDDVDYVINELQEASCYKLK